MTNTQQAHTSLPRQISKGTKEYQLAINLLGMRQITRFSADNDYHGKLVSGIDASTLDSGRLSYNAASGYYKLIAGEAFYEWRT